MKSLLFIGTLNTPVSYFESANGDGLSVYSFDEDSLVADKLATNSHIINPTFLSPSVDGAFVYANSEIDGWKEGLVTAFAFDEKARELVYLNMQATLGSTTAHNAIARNGKRLLLVNYAMQTGGPDQNVVVFDIRGDGSLSPAVFSCAQTGSGPNADRQERAHAHNVLEIGENLLLIADLGCDTLTLYRVETSRLEKISETRAKPGAGPRHMAMDQTGQFVFVANELDCTITTYRVDSDQLLIEPIETYSTLPADASLINHVADIQISQDNRFVYCSNRGHDSIVAFKIIEGTGRLTLVDYFPCGGRTPRNLAISPGGNLVLCANQDSDCVSIFKRDRVEGGLTNTRQAIKIGSPMCLRFARSISA